MTETVLDYSLPGLRTGWWPQSDPSGGALALFANRRIEFTFSTRVAIRRACDRLGLVPGDEVLAPGYNCGSELDPLRHAGLSVRLYPVDRSTDIDPDAVAARIGPRTRAVYVTHYFGFLQPQLAALRALCDARGLALIEDCALSLLSGAQPAEGRTGDVAVFCFYKFFPVIGGGVLVENRTLPGTAAPLRPAPAAPVVRSVAMTGLGMMGGHGLVERARALRRRLRGVALAGRRAAGPAAAGLPDMPAHYYFDPDLRDRHMSRLTQRALGAAEIAPAIRRRRENYQALIGLLDGMAGVRPLWPELPAGICPLNLPLLVPRRDAVAQALIAEGIPATPWWAGYNRHLDWGEAGAGRELKDNLLILPIHNGLGPAHLRHMAERLRASLRDAR